MKVMDYFGGITDLSYFGFRGRPEELWGYIYDLPLDGLLRLDIPVLNIGPSGRDDHKYTGRLKPDYSLNVVPKLLKCPVESPDDGSRGREKKGFLSELTGQT